MNDKDYLRFIHDLFEFNDENPAPNAYYRLPQSYEVQPRKIATKVKKPRKLLTEILAFCLMPNHFHLILREIKNNGITRFMQKIGTGYTMYFNQKNDRTGSLFQGRFKSISIDNDAHIIHLPYYIHANPLDLKFPSWRNRGINSSSDAMTFLENYRWSSFPDYIGKKNFPSVTSREFLLELSSGVKNYKNEFRKWLRKMSPVEELEKAALE